MTPDPPDEDEPLSLHVGFNVDGAVQIDLNKATAAIALEPETAIEVGVMLIQHAAIAQHEAAEAAVNMETQGSA